jgi:Tfp pilus assembly protein PilF
MSLKTVLATSALALLAACTTTSPQAVDIAPIEKLSNPLTVENAPILLARGLYDKAAIAYRAGLQSNPDDHEARFGLAEAERLEGKFDDARKDYTPLVEIAGWKARALEGLGRVAYATGDRAAAFEKFTAATMEDPNAWHSWLGIAQLQDFNKQWAKADEAYALALSSTKEPAVVHNNHGVSMMARGEPAAAVEMFRSALAADPKLVRAATNLDLAQAAAGQKAILDSSQADARERARKLNNYGYVAMLQDRPEDAQRYYEAAIKEHPSFYALAFNNLKTLETSKADEKPESSDQKEQPQSQASPPAN